MQRAIAAEVLDDGTLNRLDADVRAALKRRPSHEVRLAGALRVLARYSARLQSGLAEAFETTVRRSSFDRPLYGALARALSELEDHRALEALGRALGTDEAGGLAGLSAAALSRDPVLGEPLAKLAASRHPHVALAAEVARVARGESNGAHATAVAPKIKEAHRIALCQEVFVPLLWQPPLDVGIARALAVLRDAERHLGRWLVLGEVAVRAGDETPLDEAREHARQGSSGTRAAWALVAWALGRSGEPAARANAELVARLSDRPSANRDTTFLFRLAEAKVESARPMLEGLAKGPLPATEQGVRAALHLARDYGVDRCREQLFEVAKSPRREQLKGLAAAALFDLGNQKEALDAVGAGAEPSLKPPALAWAALVRAGALGFERGPLVNEPRFRRIQLGWVE